MYLTDYTFTDAAHTCIRLAEQLANEYAHAHYGAAHLLWAVTKEDAGLHGMLASIDRSPVDLNRWATRKVEADPKAVRYVDTPGPNDSAVAVLKETQKLCLRYGNLEIEPIDILEALCTPGVGFASDEIRRLPLALYEIIEWREKNVGKQLATGNTVAGNSATSANGSASKSSGNSQQILEKYCTDLTAKAREGKMDPVIGRDLEMKQLIEILGKRISPNVLLVGEPGVGKTAMLGGLAHAILEGRVPHKLENATIFELDVSGRLVAGAFKGEVEERLKSILKAIKEHEGKAILFIDEIHLLLDERGPVGSGVVNLLKPELARGEITLIGATTQTEYQKYIEKDTAFNRRFSRLVIEEPSELLATVMLKGLMHKYEDFHALKVEPEAISTAVTLAKRYVGDKYLPVSAIEIVDFGMACATQMNGTSAATIDALAEKYADVDGPNSEFHTDVYNQMSELMLGKLGDEEEVKKQPVETVIGQLRELTAEPKVSINADDIGAIISYRTNIPLGQLKASEQDKFTNVQATLRERVVGQDHVLDSVANSLKIFRANLKDPKDPGAIFFFTGPTGTGKTELAKSIAELLFDDEDAMIRFDMSEFQESHSVASLLGAPPGYVGFDKGGLLVNAVRRKPYSVVLFDEIEKAHQDIYGIFLQMLTDSRLADKQGKMADFSNTIIIFTSNAGAHEFVDLFNSGKFPTQEEMKEILRKTKHFKDEFLGRVDSNILPFKPLSEDVARMILGIHFRKFAKLLKKQHNVDLTITDGMTDHLIKLGFSPIYGARPLKNALKSFLTPPLADKLIRGDIAKGDTVIMDINAAEEVIWTINGKEVEAPPSTSPPEEAAELTGEL
ncbi:MAG: ATP-dependent Clp protease ATP-binding subunit [Bacteroidota bacterium]